MSEKVIEIYSAYCSISDERVGHLCNLLSWVCNSLQVHGSCRESKGPSFY